MSDLKNNVFLIPNIPISRRPARECKDKANIKIAMSGIDNDLCSETNSIKISRKKSVKQVNIPRSKSQIVSKSKNNKENDFYYSSSDNDDDLSDDSSEYSDSESSSSESVELDVVIPDIAKSRIRRVKSLAPNIRQSVSVPPRSKIFQTLDISEQTRGKLHIGSLPDDFPCREKEFDNIYNFLYENIFRRISGCMFISGVPGTGKTATVHSAMKCLESEDANLPPFKKILINAMHVSEPREVYSLIYKELTSRKISLKHSVSALENELFKESKSGMPILILIDEIDQLCNKKQDVLYKIFSWLKYKGSRLVLITISNTMDLAERVLHNKVASRLGVTRLSFEPYTPQQLVTIISARLTKQEITETFDPKAIELAARKVAAMSGDARRALDICRRALELQQNNKKIDVASINSVIKEMYTAPAIVAIKDCCSFYEQLFLKSVVATFKSLGFEEATLSEIVIHLTNICCSENVRMPTTNELFSIVTSLGSYRILIYDNIKNDIKLKLRLMCSQQDVLYALDKS